MVESFPLIMVAGVVALVLGAGLGLVVSNLITERRLQTAERDAVQILANARAEQKDILLQATQETVRLRNTVEVEGRERRQELQRQERRVVQKEENLDRKTESLDRRDRNVGNRERELETLRTQLDEMKQQQMRELERVSNLSLADAKAMLLREVEEEARQDGERRLREIEQELQEEVEQRSRKIVATAIQRYTADVVQETTVTAVPIPSDEMKGRIIGREGRNIRALENATGVDLIIDDTPDMVVLSCFDPVRREIARIALTKLVSDGRIHPSRVEEVVNWAKNEVDTAIKQAGEQAAYDAGVQGLHPELIKLLGRLKYRTSYGQNVLKHVLEVSGFAAIIAEELGANVEVCKKGGLLHDIGKAVDHEVEGTHAEIGADLVQRLNKSSAVAEAVGRHHDTDMFDASVETIIVQVADAISGGRPGARGDSLENYLKRLHALEGVANSFPGVEKSYAVQAGREVRVLVKPKEVDDLDAMRLARDMAKKIQESLEYPGQIKVTVIRETRAVEYAK